MKKLMFTFIILMIGVSLTNAQTAEQILDNVFSKYSNANSYYIKFEVKTSFNKRSNTNIGEVFYMRQKFNLNVGDVNQIYTGERLYTISKEDKEVTISNTTSFEDILTPTKILNNYKTDYTHTLTDKKNIGGNTIQFIKLIPAKSSVTKYCILGINISNNQIYDYKEYNKNGDTTTITVKDYIENLLIHKSYFNFDEKKYKSEGYIITQL